MVDCLIGSLFFGVHFVSNYQEKMMKRKMAYISILLLLLVASCSNDDVSKKIVDINDPMPIEELIDTNVNDLTDSIEGCF